MVPLRVCAIVVTYNRIALLRQNLDGVQGQTVPVDRIIVVDNASTDDTREQLKEAYPDVEIETLTSNMGASGGFEAGFGAALRHDWDWLWVLDDDVVPEPECLAELLEVAQESGKRVVVPRRRALEGSFPRNEAIIDEEQQSYSAPSDEGRWSPIDVFTFEGPLIHRDVVAAVGKPNAQFFIIADDTDYSIRVYKEYGPLASALANETAVNRLLTAQSTIVVKSRLKQMLMGDPTFVLESDENHWKKSYYFRNRHLIWKRLGWHRRRFRQAMAHFAYLFVDAHVARRQGWDWGLRLRVNLRSFWLGIRGKDGVFVHPASYRKQLSDRRRS